jgi:microcystin-dependent protein
MNRQQSILNFAGILISLALTISYSMLTQAAVPEYVNYQGSVQVNGASFNGTGQFKFALVDGAGTTTYWSNDGTSVAGGEPTASVALSVTGGLFSVDLGDTSLTNMTQALTAAIVADNAPVYLRVWFDDGVNGSQLLSPSEQLGSVPYALSTDTLNGHAASWYMPTGSIIAYYGATSPPGWLFCDGALVPAGSEYDALRSMVGSTLPDLRGTFLRGLDLGRGLDAGRTLGSYQADENKAHAHGMGVNGTDTTAMSVGGGTQRLAHFSGDQFGGGSPKTTNINGGAESRPKNVSVGFIIKY